MSLIEKTEYYNEFIRYYNFAKEQQKKCNVSQDPPYGMIPHAQSGIGDDLMEQIELYDVVERSYAGFSQIIHDCFYGWSEDHPYWKKMSAGLYCEQRNVIAHDWTGKQSQFGLPEWLYIFILHRVCGSGINYSLRPSGYYNTILSKLYRADSIEKMCHMIKNEKNSFYSSVGYQFPAFPKPPSEYKRGGDYYLCEYAPRLARELADWLVKGNKKDLREIGTFMLDWNVKNGLRKYFFQYAATISDIADWFPQYVNRNSLFYYGSNATECISYLAKTKVKMKTDDLLDAIMMQIFEDTGSEPYNAEDVACDFIRYITNYYRSGSDYNHIDGDTLWNSSKLIHPYGRQKAMLDLGLVKSFNNLSGGFFSDQVIRSAGLTPIQYIKKVKELPQYSDWTYATLIFS